MFDFVSSFLSLISTTHCILPGEFLFFTIMFSLPPKFRLDNHIFLSFCHSFSACFPAYVDYVVVIQLINLTHSGQMEEYEH